MPSVLRGDGVYAESKLKMIRGLVKDGILASESCPEPDYWHWTVLKPELLSGQLKTDFEVYGEVRLY